MKMKRSIHMSNNQVLRMDIIRLHYNTPVAGRPGSEKTIEVVQRSYTWPGMNTLIKEYVTYCERCAQMKPSNLALGELYPLGLLDRPWKEVTADFTTDLPLSNKFDSILLVID